MYRVFSDINNIQYSLYGTCILHTNFVSIMLLLQRELIDARAAAKAAAATAGTVAEGGAKEEGAAAK